MNDCNLTKDEFDKFTENCDDRVKCDDMACGEAFHCEWEPVDESALGLELDGECKKDKCPRLRWLK